jgi:hypothetical protein
LRIKGFEGCVCIWSKKFFGSHGHISINQVCHYRSSNYVDW